MWRRGDVLMQHPARASTMDEVSKHVHVAISNQENTLVPVVMQEGKHSSKMRRVQWPV